jgi:hypothetical protein
MASFAALRHTLQPRALHLTQRFAPKNMATQRREFSLGGSHGPPPEWTGIDKVVRGYFPEDYQCTLVIFSVFMV